MTDQQQRAQAFEKKRRLGPCAVIVRNGKAFRLLAEESQATEAVK